VPDLDELRALAERLAAEAAALLGDGLSEAREVLATKSTITDLVTAYDRRSEALIVDGILAERPDDAVLGEEGASVDGTSGVRWVIDPLDGTTNYLYGYPAFAVSIGVEVDGEPCVGVVHDVARAECFSAVLDRGATLDGRPIAVTGSAELATALVGTGFSYDPERRRRQGAVVAQLLPQVRDLRRAGAAALDLCAVAAGRLDGFYEKGLAPWDYAAGALIAREAGALVGGLDGEGPSSTFVLASAPALFQPFRALLARAGAGDA
jgi:fructose-1,6-bisphosphatase/inositol monophosphatase family enzyme